jgi:hypothetical protein
MPNDSQQLPSSSGQATPYPGSPDSASPEMSGTRLGGAGTYPPAPPSPRATVRDNPSPWNLWVRHYIQLPLGGCDLCNVDEDRYCPEGQRLREAL